MISSPTIVQAEEPPTGMVPSATAEVHRTAPTQAVRIALTQNWVRVDLEVEQHIQDCGHRMELAMARGDKAEAREWLTLQRQAIESRSEALKARMKQVIDEGLDYFSTEGERANRMLTARGLA